MTAFVVNHPDGTKSTRNSKNEYTHAVVITPASNERVIERLNRIVESYAARGRADMVDKAMADISDVQNGSKPTRIHEACVISNYGVLRWSSSATLADRAARDSMAQSFINDGCGILVSEVGQV